MKGFREDLEQDPEEDLAGDLEEGLEKSFVVVALARKNCARGVSANSAPWLVPWASREAGLRRSPFLGVEVDL